MDQNEILEKFFAFVSKNKKSLNFQDFQNFEQFISRCNLNPNDSSNIYKSINKMLINSFKYSIRRKKPDIQKSSENDPKLNTMSNLNSYKLMFKKTLEFNQTKSVEYQKFIQNLNKLGSMDLKIPLDLFKRFYKNEHKSLTENLYIVLEKVQEMINNYKESKKKNFSNKKIGKKDTYISDNESDINQKKNRSLDDNSNTPKNSHITSVSDNEIIIKNKEKFYYIMKGLTEQMTKRVKTKGSKKIVDENDEINEEKMHYYSNIDNIGNEKSSEKCRENSMKEIKINFHKAAENGTGFEKEFSKVETFKEEKNEVRESKQQPTKEKLKKSETQTCCSNGCYVI